jgi:hypothetical protein
MISRVNNLERAGLGGVKGAKPNRPQCETPIGDPPHKSAVESVDLPLYEPALNQISCQTPKSIRHSHLLVMSWSVGLLTTGNFGQGLHPVPFRACHSYTT